MKPGVEFLGRQFLAAFKPQKLRRGPAIASALSLTLSMVCILADMGRSSFGASDLREFEAGKVAEQDVTADFSVSYVDEEATARRHEELARQVPAVFTYSVEREDAMRAEWEKFKALSAPFFAETSGDQAAYINAVEDAFPVLLSRESLESLYADPNRLHVLENGTDILEYLLESGIFALPLTGLEAYNPDLAELRHNSGQRTGREQINYKRIITLDNADVAAGQFAQSSGYPSPWARLFPLLRPFLTENVFFSQEMSEEQTAEILSKAEPMMKYIERGSTIIRRGFIITEGDMEALQALSNSSPGADPRIFFGQIMVSLMLFGLYHFLLGKRTLGRSLKPAEIYLLCALIPFYLFLAVITRGAGIGELPQAVLLPTALVVILPAILISPRVAIIVGLSLPLAAFLSGSFNVSSYIFALVSGMTAAWVLRGAKRRMDLVMAGVMLGIANGIAMAAILLLQRGPIAAWPAALFWSAFNGLASGMLVLGILPPLENAMNAVTTFRLIELSDLNSPILKRLFNAAPGTYSHALMVANLAEAACQEIGADPLLARVGAYYHDIGKMDNPGYFVENQTSHNKHDDINPRLSVTVIRSHVKLGVEKARQLSLPGEVVDIIAEHHGNSVISWFYDAALKKDPSINEEDFSYPGNPPRSRESAVVMLADVTEAAVRTLKKPSASRLEKYIQELIMGKVEHGQLTESELTFRDLETIKQAFVRVLAGHYHSRIEYPRSSPATESVP
ncbi:MAG: HDIG domain-containing protein [Treponema sp.]|nr:HDIG domain-containing protein [Treponema sp.]